MQSLQLLALLAVSAVAQSVTLSQFQQINGFPSGCTKAYNTPIPGCVPSDFQGSNVCSQACVSGLMALTSLINSACAGVSTSPSTLIGLFFEGKGVQALCPETASAPSQTPPQQTATPPVASSSPQPPQQTTTSQVVSVPTSPVLVPPLSSVSTSSEAQTSQTSQTSQPTQASPSSATTTSSSTPALSSTGTASSDQNAPTPLPSFTLSSPATSAVTANPQTTSSTNSFGGSIDPFGGSASAASDLRVSSFFVASTVGVAVLLGYLS